MLFVFRIDGQNYKGTGSRDTSNPSAGRLLKLGTIGLDRPVSVCLLMRQSGSGEVRKGGMCGQVRRETGKR